MLEYREALGPGQRERVPVPVLLDAAEWSPARRLADWAADQLHAQYPFLGTGRYGADAAAHLVTQGHVALFLDGFDEMRSGLRGDATAEINAHATSRVVLFSRTEEFDEAVAGVGRLRGAAVLELSPVTRIAAVEYLAQQRQGWGRSCGSRSSST